MCSVYFYGEGTGDIYIKSNVGSIISSEIYVEDCILYDSTDYVNIDSTKNFSLPSSFKLIFTINSDSYSTYGTDSNSVYIRFNSDTGVWCGKGSTVSRNIQINGQTLHQIPSSTDTEYTLSYNNGSATLTSGTSTVTTNVSLTKLYQIHAQDNNHAHLKNIKIKPL